MPTVLSLDPTVLEVDTFSDIEGVRDITAPLRGADHLRPARPTCFEDRADIAQCAVGLCRSVLPDQGARAQVQRDLARGPEPAIHDHALRVRADRRRITTPVKR